ncbi:MAG: tetratricopeptide repeat protein [Candidatus Marinimicrobia bacterium]|nr:tetratricopeptide repeat protein [Candidatus Neomarinimicrobiota bacterium]
MKRYLLLLLLFTAFSFGFAGSGWKQVGIKGGPTLLQGDRDGDWGYNYALFYNRGLNNKFSLNLSLGYNKLVNKYRPDTSANLSPLSLYARYNLINRAKISPFIDFGIGAAYTSFQPDDIYDGPYIDFLLLSGMGLEIPVGNRISFLISSHYNFTTSDLLDEAGGNDKDGYFTFQAGLGFNLSSRAAKRRRGDIDELYTIEGSTGRKNTVRSHARDQKRAATSGDSLKKIQRRLQEMDNKIAEYKANQQENNRKINTLINLIDEKNAIIDSLRQLTSQQQSDRRGSGPINTTRSLDIRSFYKKSLNLFNDQQYQQAANNFKYLFVNYPNHELTGNFAYWAGESYYGLKSYNTALEYFNKVRKYPDNPKNDEALLMAGQALLQLGRLEEGREKFKQLLEEYPNSEYFDLAREYLSR